MAIDDQIDDDEAEAQAKPKKKSNLLVIILSVVSVLLLLVVSVGATLIFTGALSGGPPAHEQVDAGDGADPKKEEKKKAKGKDENAKPHYVELGDPLIVNFVENNQIRYLQVKMEVMTYDETMPDRIKEHLPLIRNNLLMMLSDLDYETISSFTGKQKIREEALAEVQSIMKDQLGDKVVEELYFTSFVMQ
ncbi:MAG TPA: flagellar basal body-associated FliL family protein [Chromatiales bacterium]|nr:flagellar basal body-associated FliL family protein [Chromatiales bacterium]